MKFTVHERSQREANEAQTTGFNNLLEDENNMMSCIFWGDINFNI